MNWLFLRGLSREQRHWGTFPARFEHSTSGRAYFLDLPGMGTEHGRASPRTVEAIAEDVRARWQVLRATHDGPWGLLAMSLGGMVAMAWCAAHPDDFERLVLLSTSTGDLSNPLERFSPALVPNLLRTLAARDPVAREERVLAMSTCLVRDRRSIAEEWARFQRDRPIARVNVLWQLRAAAAFHVPARVEVPTLVLAGGGDRMVHSSCAARLASRLRATLEIHPEAGHDLALDAPGWVADRVVAWIDASAERSSVGGASTSAKHRSTSHIDQKIDQNIDQNFHGERMARLRKEIVRIDRPSGGALFATRKGPLTNPAATLVLFHGLAQNRYAFHIPGHSFTGWLADAGIDTWNVEMQGVGHSRHESSFVRSLDEMVDGTFVPAVRAIAHRVGRPVFVLGHSLGGGLVFAGVPAVRDDVAGAISMAAIHRFTEMAAWSEWLSGGLAAMVRALGTPPVPVHLATKLLALAPVLADNALFRTLPLSLTYPGTVDRSKLQWWFRNAFEHALLGPVLQLCEAVLSGSLKSLDASLDYGHRWETMRPLPVLGVAADRDPFVPIGAARESIERSPGTDVTFELRTRAHGGSHWGHADLVHGRAAPEFVWSPIRDWILRRA